MILLSTDMDGTLFPNAGHENNLPVFADFYAKFYQWISERRHKLRLAYITGRNFNSALQAMAEYQTPIPDYLVTDVGSAIYVRYNDNYLLSKKWHKQIANDFKGFTNEEIQTWFSSIPELRLQKKENQTDLKVSFYSDLSIHELNQKKIRDKINLILNNQQVNAQIILSRSFDHPVKQGVTLIDILPKNAAKKGALYFLAESLRLKTNQVIFCGDSGNDTDALSSEYLSVLVGNATDEVRDELRLSCNLNHSAETTFFASKPYAMGIAEALFHFGLTQIPIE